MVHLAYSDMHNMEMLTGVTFTRRFYVASDYRPPGFVSSIYKSQKIESVFKNNHEQFRTF